MKIALTITILLVGFINHSQTEMKDNSPYYELPEYPETFTAGTMASRLVDALGFRFYWATDSLNEKDLVYKANPDGRSVEETMKHIYDLSEIIVDSTLKQSNNGNKKETLSYLEMRLITLTNLETASKLLRESNDISEFKIDFGSQQYPFWNQVNGPIADAIWHCGQIANSRRATGNPINPNVNHFTGKVNN